MIEYGIPISNDVGLCGYTVRISGLSGLLIYEGVAVPDLRKF